MHGKRGLRLGLPYIKVDFTIKNTCISDFFTYEVLDWHEPCLAAAYPREVERVYDGRPQQLEGEGPVGEAEARLLLVAHLPVRQDQRDGRRQAQRDALRRGNSTMLRYNPSHFNVQ